MPGYTVTKTRIQAGIWEGVVTADDPAAATPALDVTHLERALHSVALTPVDDQPGTWVLRIAIPPETLSEGIQVYLIRDRDSGETLDAFSVMTGDVLDEDIRAEVELLRAELDMLKRAFRRHCREG